MTKKEFKKKCSFHEYGKGKKKRNAIYFDWMSEEVGNKFIVGFKYMVKGTVEDLLKTELFNYFYEWVINEKILPWYIEYHYASTDEKRFKVSIMG